MWKGIYRSVGPPTPPTPTPPHTTTTGMFSGDKTKCYLHLLAIFVLNDILYIYDSTCFI